MTESFIRSEIRRAKRNHAIITLVTFLGAAGYFAFMQASGLFGVLFLHPAPIEPEILAAARDLSQLPSGQVAVNGQVQDTGLRFQEIVPGGKEVRSRAIKYSAVRVGPRFLLVKMLADEDVTSPVLGNFAEMPTGPALSLGLEKLTWAVEDSRRTVAREADIREFLKARRREELAKLDPLFKARYELEELVAQVKAAQAPKPPGWVTGSLPFILDATQDRPRHAFVGACMLLGFGAVFGWLLIARICYTFWPETHPIMRRVTRADATMEDIDREVAAESRTLTCGLWLNNARVVITTSWLLLPTAFGLRIVPLYRIQSLIIQIVRKAIFPIPIPLARFHVVKLRDGSRELLKIPTASAQHADAIVEAIQKRRSWISVRDEPDDVQVDNPM